jgi:purine-binding chemotaxis protein CheW
MTAQTNQADPAGATGKDESQLVTFQLGEEEFGFDIMSVQEIIRLPKLARVPRAPDYVEGVANLRGVVLPVVDTRTRFGMPRSAETDHTRVLVVEVNGTKTGLRVDRVRRVTRVTRACSEPPPPAIRGVHGDFLKSVVKLDDGKRIIMALDPARVCEITLTAGPAGGEAERLAAPAAKPGVGPAVGGGTVGGAADAGVEQMVTFRLGVEEFAFRIGQVREILRVEPPKEVPGTPAHVLGVLTVRGRILPIIDLRRLLGHSSLAEELAGVCDGLRAGLEAWLAPARAQVAAGSKAVAVTGPEAVRAWVGTFNPTSPVLRDHAVQLRATSDAVVKACAATSAETFEAAVAGPVAAACSSLVALSGLLGRHVREDQRVIVVESVGRLLGLVVDRVSEVLNVSRALIDLPPEVTRDGGMALSGIAKLQDGKRLILLLDNDQLLAGDAPAPTPADGQPDGAVPAGDTKEPTEMRDQQAGGEQQLVTFLLDNEEYGIPISQIQEIDRVGQVKRVPKAPFYVEGVTNLRGEVVPVINTRKRFDLPPKARDDRDRIIIVDVDGRKTGLLVDSVRENLNLPQRDVSPPPATLDNGVDSRFVSGIGKVDGGKRMIVLLDVRRVLATHEPAAAVPAAA